MANESMEATADLPELQRGRAFWAERRWSEAIECFERGCNVAPRNVRARLEAARALGQRYQVDRALRWLDEARKLAGTDPRIAPLVAQGYRWSHRPKMAIEAFEQLLNERTLPAPWLGEMAVLCEQTNQLDAARQLIERCIDAAPNQPEPRLILARLQRSAGELVQASAQLEKLKTRTDLAPLLKSRIESELALVFDSLEQYDDAWSALERSKEHLRQLPQTASLWQKNAAINRHLEQVYGAMEGGVIARWQRERLPPDPRCRGFVQLLGFPRSGTTLLEQILGAHPSLVSSPERAVFANETLLAARPIGGGPFSVESLDQLTADQLAQLRTDYLTMMEAVSGISIGGRLHLDKNPNHTSLSAAIVRIFPESQFLFALRDPRDILVSVYFQFFPLTEFSSAFLTLDRAVQQYDADLQIGNRMRTWLGDRCLVVRYEELVVELESVARRLLQFLGLEWDPTVMDYRATDPTRVVNSPSQAAVRQPVHTRSMGRWRHYERFLGNHCDALAAWCETLGYSAS